LQQWDGADWRDIPGTVESNNRYAQSFYRFATPVTTQRVRYVVADKGSIRVREIKLFDAASMRDIPESWDVSGIQRTGEVVRLFAKGFKDARPLIRGVKSVVDPDVDVLASFSPSEMRYYVWLVQRKTVSNALALDLRALRLPAATRIIAECVSASMYGGVSRIDALPADGVLRLPLPAQSVMLLTIPLADNAPVRLAAAADATVRDGKYAARNFGSDRQIRVEMNASAAGHNQVSYVRFDLSTVDRDSLHAALFRLRGNASPATPYRFHVYALTDGAPWDEQTLTWDNAPALDRRDVRVTGVGQRAQVAGELVVGADAAECALDVTPLIRECRAPHITFVLIREVRQLGDDADNGKRAAFDTREGGTPPELLLW
jgi:hypothetical protein